ncbi:RidA family protein [Aquimarina agarivorans]|uniref:RidA family protein n=1 Tax=Aquimarina agarivorans TaxID=980584 RepID=UPI000248E798|nr:RidA family protein [Aquimarina agarivorans]
MSKRENISSGSPWEDKIGYSRAVKIGNTIELSGTTAPGDTLEAQTKGIIELAKKVLEENGSGLQDVVRTRIFTTDISQWEKIGKVHGSFFGTIKPVTTMVEISKLIDPDIVIEIEFTAVITD